MRGSGTVFLVLLAVAACWSGTLADPVCRIVLVEETSERDDLALAVDLAEADLVAAQEIYVLLDELWRNEAVERLVYLTGKHDRDAAKLAKQRSVQLLERQDAYIEQLRALCGAGSTRGRDPLDRALARYLEADCDRLATEVELAEVDLAYGKEVLASFRDLRENDVATAQDVIIAERDVARSKERLESGRARADKCRADLGDENP